MYTIFIPKYEGDPTEYLITQVIELYMRNSCCNYIISSPGYMSTTSNTISMFVDELGNKMPSKEIFIGFFNGINGKEPLRHTPFPDSKSTIREEHENRVAKSSNLNLLPICCNTAKDHRKMMFFIECNCNMSCQLGKSNCKCFLDHSTVCGVLIGSSNQSLGTYFGGRNSASADKGEADVLMYTDHGDSITKQMIEFQSNHRNIRISKSIDEISYRTDDDDNMFFKEILKNFLEKNLI